MEALGAIRPNEWELPLFVHVLGAMALVGSLTLAVSSLAAAWQSSSAAMTKLGYRALLWAALPAYLVMRVGAEWIGDKEGVVDDAPDWVDIGYGVSDIGLLVVLIATICAGIGNRRLRNQTGSARTLDRVALVLVSISLLAYLVAVWAMTTKPA